MASSLLDYFLHVLEEKCGTEGPKFLYSSEKFFENLLFDCIIRPHAFNHIKEFAIVRCPDGSSLIYGGSKALIRFLKKGGGDAVVKMRINGEEVPIALSKLKDKIQLNGALKYRLTPDEGDCIFKLLHDNEKNKIVFYAKDRPKLTMHARIYSTNTRSCFNGALDSIFVEDGVGSVKNSGLFVSLSKSSKCLRKAERTTDVQMKINGLVVSIELERIRQKSWRGVPKVKLTPQENKQIYEHLHEGMNSITFYIEGHPDSEIHAYFYKWSHNSKVVIVDIDGTVTISNGLGIVKNFTGEDYFQPGICKLLWDFKKQGYEILYLTARPVSAIHATRRLLADNLAEFSQEYPEKPPPGPVITCCNGRVRSIFHYVGAFFHVPIFVSHEKFKTDLLSKISTKVFQEEDKALFAGFGDTKSDSKSYRKVDIPDLRNFRVLKNGDIEFLDGSEKIKIAPSDWFQNWLSNLERGPG